MISFGAYKNPIGKRFIQFKGKEHFIQKEPDAKGHSANKWQSQNLVLLIPCLVLFPLYHAATYYMECTTPLPLFITVAI